MRTKRLVNIENDNGETAELHVVRKPRNVFTIPDAYHSQFQNSRLSETRRLVDKNILSFLNYFPNLSFCRAFIVPFNNM